MLFGKPAYNVVYLGRIQYMKSLKFLTVLILPLSVYISFISQGWLAHLPLIVFFGVVPLAEFLIQPTTQNLSKEEEQLEKQNKMYTYILYAMIPIQLFFLYLFFGAISEPNLATSDLIGRIIGMGHMSGIIGINVGHELGHRNKRMDEFLSLIHI